MSNRFFAFSIHDGWIEAWAIKTQLGQFREEQAPRIRAKAQHTFEVELQLASVAETEPSMQIVALLELDDGRRMPVPLLRCCEHCDGQHQGAQCPTTYPAPRAHPGCAYCDADAVSGMAIEHNGLHFCSVGCLWDAAYCDGFDTALDKVREKKFEPLGEVLAELELETINTAPRRTARKGSSRS